MRQARNQEVKNEKAVQEDRVSQRGPEAEPRWGHRGRSPPRSW